MSGFELLAPLGLAALVSVPLVILFHMRHTTPRQHHVPTLRFWLVALQEQVEEARFRRPPLSLFLLLHLLIAGAIAFALTRPVTSSALAGIGQRTEPRHLILLLDGSTSMTARDEVDGRTRYEVARDEAVRRLDDLREGDVATVLILGTHLTTREATDAANFKALRDQLGRFPAPGGRADLNAALGLAKDLVLPDLDDQIVLISDGKLTADSGVIVAVGAPIELVTVGDPATPNVAITGLSTRASAANPAERELFAQITNFSSEPETVPYEVKADDVVSVASGQETIEGGASFELVTSVPAGTAEISITVNHDDALPADNEAAAVLAEDDDLALRILLVSDAPTTMQRVLSVLTGAQVTVEGTDSPAVENVGSKYDLVVYESWTPAASSLPDAPVLFVHPPQGGLFEIDGVMSRPAAQTVRAQDPLLFGVELPGVTFGEEVPDHLLAPSDIPVASGADGPLIYRGKTPGTGQPMVVLTFDVGQSNMPQRNAFPILMTNITNDLAPSPLPSSVPLGEPLVYRPGSDAATVRFVPPAGEPIEIRITADESAAPAAGAENDEDTAQPVADQLRDVAFADTGQPGEYGVVELNGDGKELGSGRFIVNAGSSWESDLRTNPDLPELLSSAQATDEVGLRNSLSDLWPALVMAALSLLTLEWLLTVVPWRRHRRRGHASLTGRAAHG